MKKSSLVAVSALLVLAAGCRTTRPPQMPPPEPEEVQTIDLAGREVEKVEHSFLLGTLSPLAVDKAYGETVRQIRNGRINYKGVSFFSGMTDFALVRQAVMSWNLAPLFEKIPQGATVSVQARNTDLNLLKQGLIAQLAANKPHITVLAGDQADFTLYFTQESINIYRSWNMKGSKPYLQRYAAAGAYLELLDSKTNRVVFSAPVESSGNFIGSNEPLCFLPATRGEQNSEQNISVKFQQAIQESGMVDESTPNYSGYAFGPDNSYLIYDAFRNADWQQTGVQSCPGGVLIQPDYDSPEARAIRSLLLEHGIDVRLQEAEPAPEKVANWILDYETDYTGVTTVPGSAGKFLRRGTVVFWVKLYEIKSGRILWAGQLTGHSKVQEDYLLFHPLLFPKAEVEKETPKCVVKSR